MDPVSALGLASAVVAIVDFSWKLITGAWEIHQSLEGVTADNAHLEDLTGRLESLMQALATETSVKTTAERNILHLAKQCKQDSEALRALLTEMKGPGRKSSLWKSANAKGKSIMKKREVSQLKGRIQESRESIHANIISMLKEDQSAVGIQLARIERDCRDLKTEQPVRLNELKAELLGPLREHGNTIQQQLQVLQRSITTIPVQNRILRHLLPDETGSREDQILEADPETCRWILEPGAPQNGQIDRQKIHEDFIHWLKTGTDVLHISGNPGSGKSTLMKFIAGNSRTHEELRAWVGNKRLIFAQFYMWTAGTEAQRTVSGMMQSLLFQVLSQHPDLIQAVFPDQLNRLKASQSQSDFGVEKSQYFNSKTIREAFDAFLTRIANSEYKVFFLVDGLDECEGGDLGHEDLADTMKSWATGGDIKLLVSSRPWRPFLTTFTTYQTLHLHELNHDDIKTYAINVLRQDREIRQIGIDSMTTTIEHVVEELSRQAQGIFLWAHLVLDEVRRSIRRKYSLHLLTAKIREYPSDLDDLYDALREPIEKSPIDRLLSNRMLLLAAAAPKDYFLYLVAFSWLPDDGKSGLLDPNFPPSTNCQPYSKRYLKERLECAVERMNGLTRGLLELEKPEDPACPSCESTVRFCHRTARDYLLNNVKRKSALEGSWPGFHVSDPYGRIYLANLIYNRDAVDAGYMFPRFCCDFKFETLRKFEEPMQSLASSFFGFDELDHHYSNHNIARFKFLRYVSLGGLDSFALEEASNYFEACLHPPEIFVLLADSMYSGLTLGSTHGSGGYQLASGLLKIYLNRDIIGAAHTQLRRYPVHRSTKLPVWIFALIISLDNILNICHLRSSDWKLSKGHINPSLVELCRLLNEVAMEFGQRLSVTVALESRSYFQIRGVTSFVDSSRKIFSAARLLEWLECPAPGPVDLLESELMEEDVSNERVSDTGDIIWEKSTPCFGLSNNRITSWNLTGSSGSINGVMRFDRLGLRDLE